MNALHCDHRWQICKIKDCDLCQQNVDDGYVMSCDECCEPGHSDANGWVMSKDNQVYCQACADKLGIEAI